MNTAVAQRKYRNSVLEAAAELSHQFHDEFLDYIVKKGVSQNYLDPRSPASSFENVKKGFLFYLNASGRYLVLREHLRHAVSNILQQKCTNLRPKGFKSRREFQNFLHDMYLFLVDEMHEALNTTAAQEVDPVSRLRKDIKEFTKDQNQLKKCRTGPNSKKWIAVQNILFFAQESFAQGDYENSHRLQVERVARSGESSECWADFGIMWLSRGDDRLAQIAVREALLKNEKNIKALIISGVVAARHKDSRAITCLGAALKLRPIAPELLVLIGAAHNCLGNEVASDYFFKKARFVHSLLIGKAKDNKSVQKEFGKLSVGWNILQAGTTLDHNEAKQQIGKRPFREDPTIPATDAPTEAGDSIPPAVLANSLDEKRKSLAGSGSSSDKLNRTKGKNKTISEIPEDNESRQDMGIVVPPLETPEHEHQVAITKRPQYSFAVEEHVIRNKDAGKFSKLPSMGPCIVHVWNVTKSTIRFQLKSNQMLKGAGDENGTDLYHTQNEEAGEFEAYEYDPSIFGEFAGEYPFEQEDNEAAEENLQNEPEKIAEDVPESNTEDTIMLSEPKKRMKRKKGKTKSKKLKKEKEAKIISRRVGSELIWTAHVLLKLRLFDFLDGVLARELTFNSKREVPFLYIRAVSLHLRQRDQEATKYIEDALKIQPGNPILWALKGHCYYNLQSADSALESYERALKLPHGRENMHLVYLRLGSIYIGKENLILAKKIFIKGVHYFPSPYMWMAVGNTCYRLKEYSQAETAFAEANRLDSKNPIIWAHLCLVSLAKGHKTLAEQSYKWAIRCGLKKCRLIDEIKEVYRQKGFGPPCFPKIPTCIPHEAYMKRLGRDKPFEEYKDALKFTKPKEKTDKYGNTLHELKLIKRLKRKEEKLSAKQGTSNTETDPEPPIAELAAPAPEVDLKAATPIASEEEEANEMEHPSVRKFSDVGSVALSALKEMKEKKKNKKNKRNSINHKINRSQSSNFSTGRKSENQKQN